MHILLFFLVFVFALILIVIWTILRFVFKVKNAFSGKGFTNQNDTESNSYTENDESIEYNSQIVRSAEGRRRLDKLKESAEITEAEIIE